MIINGPNLNLTGIREPSVYGTETLDDINKELAEYAKSKNIEPTFFQNNCEGEIIGAIHSILFENFDGAIINAGAYTHYSYAIRDAISATDKPFIEVHMSDITKREDFRKNSVISKVCKEQIMGYGKDSYKMALDAITKYFAIKD